MGFGGSDLSYSQTVWFIFHQSFYICLVFGSVSASAAFKERKLSCDPVSRQSLRHLKLFPLTTAEALRLVQLALATPIVFGRRPLMKLHAERKILHSYRGSNGFLIHPKHSALALAVFGQEEQRPPLVLCCKCSSEQISRLV